MMMDFLPQLWPVSHIKLLLLLTLVLKFQIENDNIIYEHHFYNDLRYCRICFNSQVHECKKLFKEMVQIEGFQMNSLTDFIPIKFKRETRFLEISNTMVFAKYYGNSVPAYKSQKELEKQFYDAVSLLGMQICPTKSLLRFIDLFNPKYNEVTILLYLVVNIELLLMPYLGARDFAVPATYGVCGFSIFQQDAGQPLTNFYARDFVLKLRIAQQLLSTALMLSEGSEGFRLYVTDLNPDNIMYNEELDRVSIVDLDTVLIVDSLNMIENYTHRHEYIECMNCFAYSQQDICQYSLSDINLFSTCQLLREDLKKDRTKGFLYPIPSIYSKLIRNLNECVDCSIVDCKNRFRSAGQLIILIKNILLNGIES